MDCCFVVIGCHGIPQSFASAAKNRTPHPTNEVHSPNHPSYQSAAFSSYQWIQSFAITGLASMVSRTIFTSMTKGCFTMMLVLAALVIF